MNTFLSISATATYDISSGQATNRRLFISASLVPRPLNEHAVTRPLVVTSGVKTTASSPLFTQNEAISLSFLGTVLNSHWLAGLSIDCKQNDDYNITLVTIPSNIVVSHAWIIQMDTYNWIQGFRFTGSIVINEA